MLSKYRLYVKERNLFPNRSATTVFFFTRVASIFVQTYKRILSTLMQTVYNALTPQVKIDGCKYWLDSKTTLSSINNQTEWRQFVQHRVNEILKITKKEEWGNCVGVCNPADLGSRGVSASVLRDSRLWWEGPHWLSMSKEH